MSMSIPHILCYRLIYCYSERKLMEFDANFYQSSGLAMTFPGWRASALVRIKPKHFSSASLCRINWSLLWALLILSVKDKHITLVNNNVKLHCSPFLCPNFSLLLTLSLSLSLPLSLSLTDFTVVCPWEAFGDMELSDLAKYGIV